MENLIHSITNCKNCGEPLDTSWEQCPACLHDTRGTGINCPSCGSPVKTKWRMCPACKVTLNGYETPTGINSGSPSDSSRAADLDSSGDDGIFLSVMPDGSESGRTQRIQLPISDGDVLGEKNRYTIKKQLGVGGSAAVYLAHDSVLNEEVALKIVVVAECEGKADHALEQILHEFRLRKKINDTSHIVKSEDPRPCDYKGLSLVLLPMELADGGSLRQWAGKNRDVEKRRTAGIKLFNEACVGVKAIHDAGLVHLDVKPENILIVNGKAKMTDFGIGRFAGCGFDENPERLLQQGVGTPHFMSPEQFHVARQKDITQASDIYSLGLVLYEILDGTLPFDGSPIELRDKHLKDPPPALTGSARRWWPVLERCLAKAPEKRYSSIELLLKDLHRTEQGAALSVDVACPECGHINANANLRICKNCKANLDSRFRPCHQCAREVRLDVESCPGCGSDVAAHYLLLQRRKEIEDLKDKDPVEAISLLELVLRDGAGQYQDHALQLIRELREKQSEISSLIAEAEEASAAGKPERALEAWQRVLTIVPRHRVALANIREADSLLATFSSNHKNALQFMDKADFGAADELLQECLRLFPANDDVNKDLQSCRQRASGYASALERTKEARKDKLLAEAMGQVQIALQKSPLSEEALEIQSALAKQTDHTKSLLENAATKINRADFNSAQQAIQEILEHQLDLDGVETVKKKLLETKGPYTSALEQAECAKRDRRLGKATEMAKEALKHCPDSTEARTLIEVLKAEQTKARDLLDNAKEAIKAASFEIVDEKISEAERLWPEVENLAETKQSSARIRADYETNIELVRKARASKDLSRALEAAHSAAKSCPNSRQATDLAASIEKDQATVSSHMQVAKVFLNAAQFDKAREKVERAKFLWRSYSAIDSLEEAICTTENEYGGSMGNARRALSGKKFRPALSACCRALELCPESNEAKQLKERIEQKRDREEGRRIDQEIKKTTAITWAVIITSGVIGLILCLFTHLVAGSLAASVSVASGLVNWKMRTRLFLKAYHLDSVYSDSQAIGILIAIPLVISGLIGSVLVLLEFDAFASEDATGQAAMAGILLMFPVVTLGYGILENRFKPKAIWWWTGSLFGSMTTLIGFLLGSIWLSRWCNESAWPWCKTHQFNLIIILIALVFIEPLIQRFRLRNYLYSHAETNRVIVVRFICAITILGVSTLIASIFANAPWTSGTAAGLLLSILVALVSLIASVFRKPWKTGLAYIGECPIRSL